MGVLLPDRVEGLEESFQTFNQLSETLESTYHRLEDRVAQLHVRLADVQEKRQAENDEHDRASQRYNSVLNSLPAGVVVLDISGHVQECNPAAVDLLGGPLRGEIWRDVVKRAFSPQSDDGHEISLNDGRLVSLSTCPLGADPGQVLLLTDVTETRHLQQRLNQHNRLAAMGQMAAGVAHQIRTPLASGLLYGSQLKNQRLDESKRFELTDKVLKHMRQLEGLVNDMLLFSKTGYSGTERVSVLNMIEEIVDDIQHRCDENNISFSLELNYDTAEIVGNKSIIQSAINNLINNAIQVMEAGGKIVLSITSQCLGAVDIQITDSGPGVCEQQREQIFEPFYTTRSQGTGLGLSVVKAIARAHQGEVWLDEDVKTGARFIMRLPIISQTQVNQSQLNQSQIVHSEEQIQLTQRGTQ